jgi:hypothetical protein
VRRRAVSLRSHGATLRGLQMCGGGVRVGDGFSRRLVDLVQTQAHLASRCCPGWRMLKKFANLKPRFLPEHFLCSPTGFSSKVPMVHRLIRRGRLRKVFKRSRSGRGATTRSW